MTDYTFFRKPTSLSLAQIAAKTGAILADPADADFIVEDVASLDKADVKNLSFLDNKKFRSQFSVTKAGAVIVHPDMVSLAPTGVKLLVSKTPYKTYALAAQAFYPEVKPQAKISETAKISPTAKIGSNVYVGDFAIIGDNAIIGDDCWIEHHAVVGDGVSLGKACRVGTHASVSHAVIGNNVRLYTGARVGQDGFGFAIDPTGFVKVPQLGRVAMGDNIEIGANTCIDRGASHDTTIGSGTWIDNLVQIAHNVKIGRGCVIVAQCGIAGSTEIGDFTIMGGQVGVSGHLKIGSMVRIAAKSGVTKNIPDREEWMGYPATPMKRFLRQTVSLANLVDRKKDKNHD
jgi:UDP-3-O-[3-hydroxymyristoyl] glucosamine N-acyltransferase